MICGFTRRADPVDKGVCESDVRTVRPMMLRIVAVLSNSSKLLEMAREDTGSPVSIYVRTMPARIWRLRRSWSAAVLIAALGFGC